MPKSARHSPPGWGPAWFPLAYLLLAAVPLSVWTSPGADGPATARLAAGVALCLLVSIAPRWKPVALPGRAVLRAPFPARAYLGLGAGFALFHERFAANELAGVMLLFVPLAAALALGAEMRGVWRLQAALLTLLFGGLLAAAGSRGGFLALLAAAGAMLLARGHGRRLALALLAAALLAVAGPRQWIDWAVYDGKAQGLTFESLLTGRPEIWRRSLHASADFSVTGIGIGSYPEVVPALYWAEGSREGLEDAHNLLLQTTLDLGGFGLLAFVVILWRAFRRAIPAARRGPPASLQSAWALGLFGSLVAFTVFNLFDSVGISSAGGVGFWFLLGLGLALPAGRHRLRRWRPRRLRRAARIFLLAALLTLLGLPSRRSALDLNRAAVLAARAVATEPDLLPAAERALAAVRPGLCRAGWLEGKVAAARGRREARDDAWAGLLRCPASRLPASGGSSFIPMVEDEAPDSRRLAEAAADAQPSSAEAWFWLARIRARSAERAVAEEHYRRGLELAPRAGRAWLELGRLLAPHDLPAALEAFARSCRHGDPGANGCLAAGAAAQQLGDVDAAIRYYRMSQFSGARERADRLESGDR